MRWIWIGVSRPAGLRVTILARIIARLFLQKRDQTRQVGEAAALAGLRVLQRCAPDDVPTAVGLPEAQQERVIFVRFVRHHGPFRLIRSEGIVPASYKETIEAV